MMQGNRSVYASIEKTLIGIFMSNLWLAIQMGVLCWYWDSTQRLYYIILISMDFLKFTKQIIYSAYLYFGDFKTCKNKDKQPLQLKYFIMDYQGEEDLNLALFDTFYYINVINVIGYLGSFIYGIIYQSTEGAIGIIIVTMIGSFIEILWFISRSEDRYKRQNKIFTFTSRIKNGSNICAICLEDFQVDEEIGLELNELQCTGKHLFHQNCINAWFQNNKSCPLCKYKF